MQFIVYSVYLHNNSISLYHVQTGVIACIFFYSDTKLVLVVFCFCCGVMFLYKFNKDSMKLCQVKKNSTFLKYVSFKFSSRLKIFL